MTRPPESLKDRLATIIQRWHVEKLTSDEVAEMVLAEVPDTASAIARAETAERWKAEHLTVESWWLKIDEFIRDHPETLAGTSVAHRALTMLHERDALMNEHNALKAFLKLYVSK